MRALLLIPFAVILCLPMWWAMGRLRDDARAPFFRLLAAMGAAAVGWLGVVNLLGRGLQNSIAASTVWLAINALACAYLLAKYRQELSVLPLMRTWRTWLPVVILALGVGFPQWVMAVSTPYWDEVASSAIHITAPNQFADGVFPPRHNSFPELPVKYHYASTMLAGTLVWITGLSANVCIDLASTALHLFIFLFVFHWLAQLGMRKLAATWGAFTVLLGGGLAWLYSETLQTYADYPKRGHPSQLLHSFQSARGTAGNLLDAAKTAVFHLKNGDGSNSNLPWDIVNQFQQHGVALGIALALFAAWLFCVWLRREQTGTASPLLARVLLGSITFTYGLVFLGHAIFGTVSALVAGLLIVGYWLREPSRELLIKGLLFVAGVSLLGFTHGGVLSRGPAYGANLTTIVWRDGFGYSEGGFAGFLNWNLAGFGIPLILSIWALQRWWRYRHLAPQARRLAFHYFAVMLVVSYLPAQLLYYSYGGQAIEEHTEIAKFFFATHLALAMLSGFAIAIAEKPVRWYMAPVAFAAMAVVPMAHIYAASVDGDDGWKGFYDSPYPLPAYANAVELGQKFKAIKPSQQEVYFDTSWDEEYRRAFIDELQVHSGSVFSLTPRRYERTGSFLIDAHYVAEQQRKHGRMARLRPNAEIEAGAHWIYAIQTDVERMPLIVRSRFAKMVSEGVIKDVAHAGPRTMYQVAAPTAKIDDGIERFLQVKAVAPSRSKDLLFHDRKKQQIVNGEARLGLPAFFADDYALVLGGVFGRSGLRDVMAARMGDTLFSRGAKISEMSEVSGYYWSVPDGAPESGAGSAKWKTEWQWRAWDQDVPLVYDVDHDGTDELLAWRRSTGEWYQGNNVIQKASPNKGFASTPTIGRFIPGATLVLATFQSQAKTFALVPIGKDPVADAVTVAFGEPGDVLVPGDYDGDKVDELVMYRKGEWHGRNPITGAITVWTFGEANAIPAPYDYDHDGRLDLAYWLPAKNEIRVSFDKKTVAKTIAVPPDSIPVFVNLY